MVFTRVKICCISSIEEAQLAMQFGASALGLVSEMPSGPGVISEELIAEIAATIPPAIGSFLLTSKQDTESIIEQQKRCGVNTIQLCDRLIEGSHQKLRYEMPGVKIVQVLHVTGEETMIEAKEIATQVDGILLDSGNQSLKVKELGGTGRTHDWNVSHNICHSVAVPVFLAGGLNPENVQTAVNQVDPYGVDLCSGVRTNGKLDENKLKYFFAAVRSADDNKSKL